MEEKKITPLCTHARERNAVLLTVSMALSESIFFPFLEGKNGKHTDQHVVATEKRNNINKNVKRFRWWLMQAVSVHREKLELLNKNSAATHSLTHCYPKKKDEIQMRLSRFTDPPHRSIRNTGSLHQRNVLSNLFLPLRHNPWTGIFLAAT